jgi:hypothetical protein
VSGISALPVRSGAGKDSLHLLGSIYNDFAELCLICLDLSQSGILVTARSVVLSAPLLECERDALGHPSPLSVVRGIGNPLPQSALELAATLTD